MNVATDVRAASPHDERELSFEPVENPHPRCLTREQIAFYNENGYVAPFRIFNAAEAGRNREYFDWLLAEMGRFNDGRDSYSICSYQAKCRGLYDIMTDARILDYVQDLLGPDFVCWGAHFFCKLPHDPKAVPWHQDASQWPFDKSRTVTAWLAIDDVDEENSAMQFIPGTHRAGLLKWRESDVDQATVLNYEIENVTQYGRPVVDSLQAGEISLHADMLAHGSAPNRSARQRGGLTIRYCPVSVRGSWNNNSTIVRGSDPSGHWADQPRPAGEDLSPLPHQVRQIKAN